MFNVDGTIGQAARQQRGSNEQPAFRNPIDIADAAAAARNRSSLRPHPQLHGLCQCRDAYRLNDPERPELKDFARSWGCLYALVMVA
ncbi:hypothetical protein GCT13_20765 [Paraburkholderia sp. CNPSo 3157]|uniref:Uncharacterized protein n=1 Tax=Paraburkholderia franconis TaxID=2654983 RepID=A0A7X1NC49_9BURK|nr:hypothetical protein [Paraburkholderia franconis]MPW19262.1 hypothetical protein [Paraburkholderia franconis]